MARALTSKTVADPFQASWTAADPNIGNSGANSPVSLPDSVVGDPMLTVVFGGDVAASNPEWHLLLEDVSLRATAAGAAADESIVAVISAISATTPTPRESSRDGAASNVWVHVPIQFDMRGLPRGSNIRAYIALANLGGTTTAFLIHYATDGRPL